MDFLDVDSSKEKFLEYKKSFIALSEIPLSETDTRCKVLDLIFKDVLGWEEEDILREGYEQNSGYFDYKFSTEPFKFIVEAKKNLVEFSFPDSPGNKFKISTLINKGNSEAIQQVRNYIVEHGLMYGVISNGYQFIIAQFVNQDGSDWKNNLCYIFRSLDEIESDFITFYNQLSKHSVINNRRIKFFEERFSGETILDALHIQKTDTLVRNELSDKLVQIAADVFEDIGELEDPKILKACYVENEDIKKQNAELEILFPDNPPAFDEKIEKIRNTENTREKIKEKIISEVNTLPNPIIIIGSRGAGKTTFINYFLRVTLSEDKSTSSFPVVYLNFKNYSSQQIQDTDKIYRDIIQNLISNYSKFNLNDIDILKKIYNQEIKAKLAGVWNHIKDDQSALGERISIFLEESLKDNISHLKKIAEYLRIFHNLRLCVVFDNSDQLDDLSQKETFLLSQSIFNSIKSLVIVSLREGYYLRVKDQAPFDAYHSIVYHIAAPPYHKVLQKRLEYIINKYDFSKLRGGYKETTIEMGAGALKKFFTLISKTFFADENGEILRFLGETSYPDTRLLLNKLKNFLFSGYTKITTYITDSFDSIPIWDFIKAVALESRYYYQSEYSSIYNLFYPSEDNRDHFTKIRILKYLLEVGHSASKWNYVSFQDLDRDFGRVGYSKPVIVSEIKQLLKYRLIECNDFVSDVQEGVIINESSCFKITMAGKYYSDKLITRFAYIDLVLQDTPIFDKIFLEKLKTIFPLAQQGTGRRDLQRRIDSAQAFLEYLSVEETLSLSRNETGINALDKSIVKYIQLSNFNQDIRLVQNVIKKNKFRNQFNA